MGSSAGLMATTFPEGFYKNYTIDPTKFESIRLPNSIVGIKDPYFSNYPGTNNFTNIIWSSFDIQWQDPNGEFKTLTLGQNALLEYNTQFNVFVATPTVVGF